MSTFEVPEDSTSLFVNDAEKMLGIADGASYMICNGCLVSRVVPLHKGCKYYVFPRVLGGKGGFGSMLRAIGAQIEKTTSREACRDLSGRRIRDVNNEKKLKDWVSKQAEREREQEEREELRRAKRAKFLDPTPGRMDDPVYNAQYAHIMKKNEAAAQEGLAKLKEEGSGTRKRKAESSSGSALDKYDRWNIAGGVSMGDLDSDSGSDSNEAEPGTSSADPSLSASSSPSSSHSSDGTTLVSSSRAAFGGPSAAATITSSSSSSGAADSTNEASPFKVPRAVESSGDGVSSSSHVKVPEESATSSEADSTAKGSTKENAVECIEPVDLDSFVSAEDLHELGMERLKADLTRRGLKCGGSLQERADRLFSIKGLSADDIPPKLLAKGKGQGKSSRK